MQFNLRNIGIIERADIELKGLTVITGLNDTGKSFIGKTIYSIIKTIKDAGEEVYYNQIDELDVKLRSLNLLLKESSTRNIFIGFRGQVINSILQRVPADLIVSTIDSKREEITNTILSNNDKISALEIENIFRELVLFIESNENYDDEKKFKSHFDRIFIQQLFRSQINSLYKLEENSSIECNEGRVKTLSVNISKNLTTTFETIPQFLFQDATLIDTPIILQWSHYIRQQRVRPSGFRRDEGLPSYYLDLLAKIASIQVDNSYEDISKDIEQIVGGRFVFEDKVDKLSFEKSNGQKIESYNTASGIKAFGLPQLLLNSGVLNGNSILIIDEPEVHLHPMWEVEYARIIVKLCKSGIPILVSSHSPYFLRALTVFVKQMDFESKTKFYFGEKQNSTSSIFRDVTDDLEPIFEKLSLAMQSLIL